MSQTQHPGRHRAAAKSSRGRQILVPVVLLTSTIAATLAVRGAGASELSPDASSVTTLSSSASGAAFVAAQGAASDRDNSGRASRNAVRADMVAKAVAANQATLNAQATAAAAAAKAKADAAAKAKGVGGGTGDVSGDNAKVGSIAGERRWVAPFDGYRLTSGYGWRWGKLHPAQDLAAPTGTPVRALSSGQVIFAGWSNQGYGHLVKIKYWDNTVSWYAHNSRLLVREGQQVKPGQLVAHSGNTGNSTGPHLHLEIHAGGNKAVAPRPWLSAKGIYL